MMRLSGFSLKRGGELRRSTGAGVLGLREEISLSQQKLLLAVEETC